MSGWDAPSLAGYSFAAFLVAMGLLQLLVPQAGKAGGVSGERMSGIVSILFAIFLIARPLDILRERIFLFVMSGVAFGTAIWALRFAPARFTPLRRRVGGAIFILFGGLWLALGLAIPR